MTIMEITNREAGIIIYPGNAVAVVNWLNCDDNQIPMLSPFGGVMIPWNCEEGFFNDYTCERVDDFCTVLPGKIWLTGETDEDGNKVADSNLDIVFDDFNDLLRAFVDPDYCNGDRSAVVYHLKDGTVIIAPYMWN